MIINPTEKVSNPILIDLGIDESSISPTYILEARSQLLKLSKHEMKMAIDEILNLVTANEVECFVDNILSTIIIATA